VDGQRVVLPVLEWTFPRDSGGLLGQGRLRCGRRQGCSLAHPGVSAVHMPRGFVPAPPRSLPLLLRESCSLDAALAPAGGASRRPPTARGKEPPMAHVFTTRRPTRASLGALAALDFGLRIRIETRPAQRTTTGSQEAQLDANRLHVYNVALDLHTLSATLVASLNRIVRDQLEAGLALRRPKHRRGRRAAIPPRQGPLLRLRAGQRHRGRRSSRCPRATAPGPSGGHPQRAPSRHPHRPDADPRPGEAGVEAPREHTFRRRPRARGAFPRLVRPIAVALVTAVPVQGPPYPIAGMTGEPSPL